MKIKLINRWDDSVDNSKYAELRIDVGGAICVKETASGLRYVMECDDGKEVYSYIGGVDFPLRKLTDDERKAVMEFAKEMMK